ncbi:hypothetical protein BDW72DRAFT_208151 [Aspergillus terricola var. indicus]
MPKQPISSRLSLAQAAVSADSRSKALSLDLESDQAAEQEGWGDGQPTVLVLGRRPAQESQGAEVTSDNIGIDVLALKRAELYQSEADTNTRKALPVHNPQSACSFLLKLSVKSPDKHKGESALLGRKSITQIKTEKEVCLDHLLRSINLELERRAWAWDRGIEGGEERSCETVRHTGLKEAVLTIW